MCIFVLGHHIFCVHTVIGTVIWSVSVVKLLVCGDFKWQLPVSAAWTSWGPSYLRFRSQAGTLIHSERNLFRNPLNIEIFKLVILVFLRTSTNLRNVQAWGFMRPPVQFTMLDHVRRVHLCSCVQAPFLVSHIHKSVAQAAHKWFKFNVIFTNNYLNILKY